MSGKRNPGCNHAPNVYCLKCMKRDMGEIDKIEDERRRNNDTTPATLRRQVQTSSQSQSKPMTTTYFRTQGGTAVRGVITAKKDKPMEWMCKHKPGEICSNCVRLKLEEDKRKEEMLKIQNARKPPSKAHVLTRLCNHRPDIYCPHCIPEADKVKKEEPKEEQEEDVVAPRECPRCGKRKSPGCSYCLMIENEQRPNIVEQPAVTGLTKFNRKEIYNFQLYIAQNDFLVNRYGIMYGTFKDEKMIYKNKEVTKPAITVEAIYEPQQIMNPDGSFTLNNEQQMKNVDEMCLHLGLEKVGVIFSYGKPRDYILSGTELIEAAKRQLTWDKRCVTVVVSKKPKGITVDAYQASTQLVRLVKEGKVAEQQTQPANVMLKDDVYVEARTKRVKEVDSTLFISNLGVKLIERRVMFQYPEFPIENRLVDVTLNDFKKHFRNRANRPIYDQLLDFHLLVYCLELGIFSSLDLLRECIVDKLEKREIKDEIKLWMDLDM